MKLKERILNTSVAKKIQEKKKGCILRRGIGSSSRTALTRGGSGHHRKAALRQRGKRASYRTQSAPCRIYRQAL